MQGEVVLDGEELLGKSEKEMRKIRGKQMSMVFQDPMSALNPVLTIGEQIEEALKLHNEKGRSKQELVARVEEVLEMV
ncbi:MAG: ABC transporter ATP-binding protein, partial [Clostridia bacterium]